MHAELIKTATDRVVDGYLQHLNGKAVVAFCLSLEHVEHMVKAFNKARISAVPVVGKMKAAERRRTVDALNTGCPMVACVASPTVLLGMGVRAHGVIVLRPTQSEAVHAAMLAMTDGTGTVLDYAGNVLRHGYPEGFKGTVYSLSSASFGVVQEAA